MKGSPSAGGLPGRATMQSPAAGGTLQLAAASTLGPGNLRARGGDVFPDIGKSPARGSTLGKSLSEATLKVTAPHNTIALASMKSSWRATENKDSRRRMLELLADPNIDGVAKDVFRKHDADNSKTLEFRELYNALRTLHEEYDLQEPDQACVERLFKKFDTSNNQRLDIREFVELFKSEMRRSAFDRSNVLSREFFITKNTMDKIWTKFEKLKKLGSGTFGTAYLARRKETGEERVVKQVKKSRTSMPLDDIEQEILIMRQVDHPHVVRLFEWYEDKSNIYLVQEALKGGTLQDVVLLLQKQNKGLKEVWIRKVIGQVAEGMAYVHDLRLIHKDLKDENIMLLKRDDNFEDPFAVIIDLGVAEMFSSSEPTGRIMGGTPVTMAPEVWMGNFGPKCDVFSLGCIFFELLSGQLPFLCNTMTSNAWLRLHKRGPDWSLVKTSTQGKDLCKKMLTYSEKDRPAMRDVCQDEFFKIDRQQLKLVSPAQFSHFAKFCHENQAKRALLLEIASRLPMERATEVIKIFESLDKDRDGNVSQQELHRYFEHMGIRDPDLMQQTFNALDVNQDGYLSFSEFAAGALLLFKDVLEERLHSLFLKHDKFNDGALDLIEAKDFLDDVFAAMDQHSMGKSGQILEAIVPDGRKVTFEELRDYILGPSGSNVPSRASTARSTARSRTSNH